MLPEIAFKNPITRGGKKETQLDCYRRVRDQIRDFVEALPDTHESEYNETEQ